jgi:DnaK suppressor protein
MPELNAIKEKLLSEAESLAQRVQTIEAHLRGTDRDAPTDWRDRAQFLENDEVLEALDTYDRAQLEQIRAALRRIDAGAYTECSSCGEDIGLARLNALPITTLCVHCAA